MTDKYDVPFQYHCSEGHELGGNQPLTRCPAVVRGCPCKGELTRHGPGSRKQTEVPTHAQPD